MFRQLLQCCIRKYYGSCPLLVILFGDTLNRAMVQAPALLRSQKMNFF
ncbi:hypothetical protein N0Y54_25905 [Nostoc punctiforme UO1]